MLGRRLGSALCPRRVPGGSGNVGILLFIWNHVSEPIYWTISAAERSFFPVFLTGCVRFCLACMLASLTVQRLPRGALLFTSVCGAETDVGCQDCSFVDSFFLSCSCVSRSQK